MLSGKMNLRIKLLTLPFSEMKFYKKDYIEELLKYCDKDTYEEKCFNKFCRNIYSIINSKNIIYSLDEVKLLVKKFYDKDKLDQFSSLSEDVSDFYLEHLKKLSKIFLCHRNGRIALKYWKTENEEEILGPYSGIYKIALWNLLNRMFNIDILVLQYLLDNGMDDECYLQGYHSLVAVEDLQLEQVLNKGVAETHLHLKAGINFIISWQDLMSLNFLKNGKENGYKEISFYDEIIGNNIGLELYVRAIAIIRMVMALFLKNIELCGEKIFFAYIIDNYDDVQDIKELIDVVHKGKNLKESKFNFRKIYDELKFKFNLAITRSEITENWNESLANNDIIKDILGIYKDYSTVENVFLFRCLKYLRTCSDNYFSRIFWQYVRVKNEVFQLKIQGNSIKGLDYFKDYYSRSTKTNFSNRETVGLVLHTQFQSSNLKKLEIRTSISDYKNVKKIEKNLVKSLIILFEEYEQIAKEFRKENRSVPAIGIVYHFLKRSDSRGIEKCWLESSEPQDNCKLYFREIQESYKRQIEALNNIRENVVGLSDYIVGIDAASGENDTEPWVFAPIYEKARNSNTHKLLYKCNPQKRIRNLGFTFHAGEDFRHILTGIRRVDEVIDHLKFHAGDRIGHAIALGVDIEKWVQKNKVVILPRIEYLENLLWVWGLHKNGTKIDELDTSYLEKKIFEHAEKIYKHMEGINIYNLWRAYQSKFQIFKKSDEFNDKIFKSNDEQSSSCKLFCCNIDRKHTFFWNSEKLAHAQHCKCYLKFMVEPIQVEICDEDIKIIKCIQKTIVKKVGLEGIIIETNPTSNTAIGQIESIFQHYIFNLNKQGLKDVESHNDILVTINTDDPSVFNTNINNEFAYIFYALKENGYNSQHILQWIDSVRETGLYSSFIQSEKLTNSERIEEIKSILKNLRDYF